jgi:hypothetical protein
VGLIVAAVLLRVLSANPANSIVRDIHDAGGALAGPFKNVFSLSSGKATMAVNRGLAALVYLIVGALIARLIATPALRVAPRRSRWSYRGRRGPVGPVGTA